MHKHSTVQAVTVTVNAGNICQYETQHWNLSTHIHKVQQKSNPMSYFANF